MDQTIRLDAKKREGSFCKERIHPLRRGERNNVTLTVAVRRDRRPYDLAGMTARLVWQAADGKLVGPVPMEVTDPAAGTVRCTLPDACYSAVGTARAYIEIRNGEELVDTTDEMLINVLDCIDADAEQAEEYKPLIGEVRDAVEKALESRIIHAEAETLDPGSDATASLVPEDGAQCLRLGIPRGDTGAKGDKGDPFTYDDFTEAQILELQRPATEAVADAKAAIAEVKATEAKLYPVAENILVGSETGAVAHVEDAFSGAALRKITVEGACKQDGTPSPDSPVPIRVIENPVVKVTGRNFWYKGVVVYNYTIDYLKYNAEASVTLEPGTYTISSNGRLPNLQFFEPGSHKQLTCAEATDMNGAEVKYSVVWNNYCIAPPTDESRVLTITLTRDVEMTGCVVKSQGTWIQVEHGTKATAYAPHVGTSTPFTLPAEHPYLAALPDGTHDEIVVDREGNVELVARVGIDKNVREFRDFAQGQYYSLVTTIPPFKSPYENYSAPVMCSALPSKNTSSNNEGIYRTWNGIYVRDTSGRTKEEIQAEVDKNAPLTVVAIIPETRYPLGKIEMPKAQDSIVNAWTDAEVTPNTSISYVRDVNIVVANLESAIASITEG